MLGLLGRWLGLTKGDGAFVERKSLSLGMGPIDPSVSVTQSNHCSCGVALCTVWAVGGGESPRTSSPLSSIASLIVSPFSLFPPSFALTLRAVCSPSPSLPPLLSLFSLHTLLFVPLADLVSSPLSTSLVLLAIISCRLVKFDGCCHSDHHCLCGCRGVRIRGGGCGGRSCWGGCASWCGHFFQRSSQFCECDSCALGERARPSSRPMQLHASELCVNFFDCVQVVFRQCE